MERRPARLRADPQLPIPAERGAGAGPQVLIVLGTRPELIKLAPVIHRLRDAGDPGRPVVRVIATGQHREMLEPLFELFGIEPDVRLDVLGPDAQLTDQMSRLLSAVGGAIQDAIPRLVVVQGDTTSAFAGALAAFYRRVPVAHVEAGLRTLDMDRPFPEEMNRQVLTRLASYHFAPTSPARENLLREGVPREAIWVTGNTVVDALHEVLRMPCELPGPLARIVAGARPLLLVTAHRRESFGTPFLGICRALSQLARRHPECDLVYPVHLNPNVRGPAHETLDATPNIHLVEPLEYRAFVHLMRRSTLILTDSGGIQEEAPSLGKPVLVLRDKTERPEALAAGCVRLVGTDPARIVEEAERLLSDADARAAMSRASNPYGDGRAAERIADVLVQRLALTGELSLASRS